MVSNPMSDKKIHKSIVPCEEVNININFSAFRLFFISSIGKPEFNQNNFNEGQPFLAGLQ
jgi:hypothetical protein